MMRSQGLTTRADLRDGPFNFNRMFKRLGGVSAVEKIAFKRKVGHGAHARANACGGEAQHLVGDVQAPQFRLRVLLQQGAGEAAFSAAHIEHALAAESAPVLANQLHAVNARVEGGREMLFVTRGLVEG